MTIENKQAIGYLSELIAALKISKEPLTVKSEFGVINLKVSGLAEYDIFNCKGSAAVSSQIRDDVEAAARNVLYVHKRVCHCGGNCKHS